MICFQFLVTKGREGKGREQCEAGWNDLFSISSGEYILIVRIRGSKNSQVENNS